MLAASVDHTLSSRPPCSISANQQKLVIVGSHSKTHSITTVKCWNAMPQSVVSCCTGVLLT